MRLSEGEVRESDGSIAGDRKDVDSNNKNSRDLGFYWDRCLVH